MKQEFFRTKAEIAEVLFVMARYLEAFAAGVILLSFQQKDDVVNYVATSVEMLILAMVVRIAAIREGETS